MNSTESTEHVGRAFKNLCFSDEKIHRHSFEDCTFDGCDFRNVVLTGTRFIDCVFQSCDFSNAQLPGATIRGASFKCCKLIGIQWAQLATFLNPSFTDCNLNYCGFVGLKLKKTIFSRCSLREADFSQAEVSESDFRECDLLQARFNNTVLQKADFRGARNYLIDPIANKVRGARFSLPEAQGLLTGLGVILD